MYCRLSPGRHSINRQQFGSVENCRKKTVACETARATRVVQAFRPLNPLLADESPLLCRSCSSCSQHSRVLRQTATDDGGTASVGAQPTAAATDDAGTARVVCANQTYCSLKFAAGRQWVAPPLLLRRSGVVVVLEGSRNLKTDDHHRAASPPLSGMLTRDGARLLLAGRPFAGVGVDIVDLLWHNNTKGVEDAAALGVPFVRFAASPFFPRELVAWRADPERYWQQGAPGPDSGFALGMDAAVATA